ncbi:hypothetical protein [Nocardia sienata]|nr:hypothetical protein [Nocardia sienata]
MAGTTADLLANAAAPVLDAVSSEGAIRREDRATLFSQVRSIRLMRRA